MMRKLSIICWLFPTVALASNFTLVDAVTNTDLTPLNDGDTIKLAATSHALNIRAETPNAGRVAFFFDGKVRPH